MVFGIEFIKIAGKCISPRASPDRGSFYEHGDRIDQMNIGDVTPMQNIIRVAIAAPAATTTRMHVALVGREGIVDTANWDRRSRSFLVNPFNLDR